jgi:hypothetical protein
MNQESRHQYDSASIFSPAGAQINGTRARFCLIPNVAEDEEKKRTGDAPGNPAGDSYNQVDK